MDGFLKLNDEGIYKWLTCVVKIPHDKVDVLCTGELLYQRLIDGNVRDVWPKFSKHDADLFHEYFERDFPKTFDDIFKAKNEDDLELVYTEGLKGKHDDLYEYDHYLVW